MLTLWRRAWAYLANGQVVQFLMLAGFILVSYIGSAKAGEVAEHIFKEILTGSFTETFAKAEAAVFFGVLVLLFIIVVSSSSIYRRAVRDLAVPRSEELLKLRPSSLSFRQRMLIRSCLFDLLVKSVYGIIALYVIGKVSVEFVAVMNVTRS